MPSTALGLVMLIKSLPVFLFTEESIFSHANNIHTIFSSLPFKEIRLSQSQSKELLATALGFIHLKQLKEKLELGTFADIEMPSDAIERASKRILELTSPLPFSTIPIPEEDNEHERFTYLINQYGGNDNQLEPHYKIFKNDLMRVKSDWEDWHIVLASYICSYLKETIGHFEYFHKLKLSSHLVSFPDQLFHFARSEGNQGNRFLNSVIYNHLIVHCPIEPMYSRQLKAIPMDQRAHQYDVYLSPELKTYLEKNESILSDLQECKVNKELPLVLSYESKTEAAKLNILPDLYNFQRMNKAKSLSTDYKEEYKSPREFTNYLSKFKLDKFDIMSKCEFEISVINKHANLPEIKGLVWSEYIKFTQNDLWDFNLVSSAILRDINLGCFLLYFPEVGSSSRYLTGFNERQFKVPEHLSFTLHFTKRLDCTYTKDEDGLEVSYGVAAHLCMRYEIKANLSLELTELDHLNMSFENVRSGIKHNSNHYTGSSPNFALHLETFKLTKPHTSEITDMRKLKASHIKMKGFKEAMTSGFPLGVFKQHIQKHYVFPLTKTHQNVLNTYRLIKSNKQIQYTDDMKALMDLYMPLEQFEPHV